MQNNLAFFFPIGGGLIDLKKSGQDTRFIKGEYPYYLDKFDKVYLFDYASQKYDTNNSRLIQIVNRGSLHRFLYALLLPIIERKTLRTCGLLRVSHLLGMPPAILARWIFRVPIVFNYGYDYEGFAQMEKKRIHAWLFKILKTLAIKNAAGIICTNKKIYEELKKHHPCVIFIPNRVDTTLFKPCATANFKKDEFQILFVGRLAVQKNLLNLLKAISRLRDAKIKLTLIGRGHEEQTLKQFTLTQQINLEIVNNVANNKLPEYYQHADLFVLPSLREGSPKVLLEAMSCGATCLVSNIPENTELIKDGVNGFVCESDEKSLSDKIQTIMHADNLTRVMDAARQTIVDNYSIDFLMQKEVNFLKEIAKI